MDDFKPLVFTAQAVDEWEQKRGQTIMAVIGDTSIRTILSLVRKGLNNCDAETGYAWIEAWKKNEKKGMAELYLSIMDTLQEQGFLLPALNLIEMRKLMLTPVSQKDLAKYGETVKQLQ